MIEEINSSSMKEPKIYRIGIYNKLTMLINGFLIITSLMIGWSLWVTIGRDAINNYIKWFNNQQHNFNLQISFNIISIIVFLVSGLMLALVVVPFIFLKTKNSVSALFCLISFIFLAIFVFFLIVFFIFSFKTFTFLANKKDGEITNTTGNFIIAFLPWMLAELFAILLLIHSLWLIINITSKYKSNTLLMPIAKPKTKYETVIVKQEADDDTITLPNFISISPLQNNKEQQTANQETNNTSFMQDSKQEKIISNPSTATVYYTNHELSQTPTQGAYHSEAVSPTPGTLTNLKSESISNEEKINDNVKDTIIHSELTAEKTNIEDKTIYSKSTITENTISSETNYQPKNQGGFDVKDNSYSEFETSNFNEHPDPAPITIEETQPIIEKTKTKKDKETIEIQKVTIHHWTLEQIEAVWEKAEIIDGVSDKLYRKDYGGAWMFRDSFTTDYTAADNLETYSWTIVLHRPASQQGTTELYNLDPMNIVNAKSKGENYPSWKTKISSKGNKNIVKEQHWKART